MNRSARRRFKLSAVTFAALAGAFGAHSLPSVGLPAASAAAPSSMTANADAAPGFDVPLRGEKFDRHVLNRLAFGPRPGDIERLHAMGFTPWLDAQLSPTTLDDSQVNAKVSRLKTLQMTPQQLYRAYKADAAMAAQRKQARKQEENKEAQNAAAPNGAMPNGAMPNGVMPDGTMPDDNAPATANTNAPAAPAPAAPASAAPRRGNARRLEMLQQAQNEGLTQGTSIRALGELVTDKLVRAVESPRQLQEVLVDFWSNHFNIDVRKKGCRILKVADERDVIRPHILGRFRDLLEASAKSPAMLLYLDNALSTAEPKASKNPNAKKPKRGGLNENYARELMELHTLGVDGGYTQQDVTEVARCFTGWSIDQSDGTFMFRRFAHDNGEKVVLGQRIPAGGGIQDGERVLDILASSPATAHHISYELCRRFVADAPPATLVDHAAAVFTRTGGDLRAVVRAIATSPEFASEGAYRAKIKSPWEFAISAVRALGGQVVVPDGTRPMAQLQFVAVSNASLQRGKTDAAINQRSGRRMQARNLLAMQIATMGQPLFGEQAPTGYPEEGAPWVSSGALISRLNFALTLSSDQVPDVSLPPAGANTDTTALIESLLGGDVSKETRQTLQSAVAQNADSAKLTAMVLGSPEFQRR